jgi:hypothetical protein
MKPEHIIKWWNRRWMAWTVVLLACWLGVPAQHVSSAEPDKPAMAPATVFDARQADLIEARIDARSGKVAKAMAIYQHLRTTYPADREIQIEYCSFLVDQREYELAQGELTRLLNEAPTHRQAQQLQARLYGELAAYGWSVFFYDRLIQADPNDAGVWSDYAGARLNRSQWAAALANYSRVLELDPDNRDVRQMVHQILKDHGPRLDINHQRYAQPADDTTIDTMSLGWTAHVSEATRLFADYRYIDLARPEQPFAGSVDGYFNDILLKLEHKFNQRWSALAGIGGYSGASRDTSYLIGAGLTPATGININAEYQANRPWYDPVDAIENGGSFNRLRLSLDWNDGQRAGVVMQGEDWRYCLDGADRYGRQQTLLGMLTWRLLPAPELVVGYSYYRSWFDYAKDDYRPVAMVEDQGWHSIFGTLVHHPCAYWSWSASAGFRYDHVRSLTGWFFQPAFKLFMGNRLELDGSYDYSSESTGVVGGETQTFQISARVYF